jgi:hypothetical protein
VNKGCLSTHLCHAEFISASRISDVYQEILKQVQDDNY